MLFSPAQPVNISQDDYFRLLGFSFSRRALSLLILWQVQRVASGRKITWRTPLVEVFVVETTTYSEERAAAHALEEVRAASAEKRARGIAAALDRRAFERKRRKMHKKAAKLAKRNGGGAGAPWRPTAEMIAARAAERERQAARKRDGKASGGGRAAAAAAAGDPAPSSLRVSVRADDAAAAAAAASGGGKGSSSKKGKGKKGKKGGKGGKGREATLVLRPASFAWAAFARLCKNKLRLKRAPNYACRLAHAGTHLCPLDARRKKKQAKRQKSGKQPKHGGGPKRPPSAAARAVSVAEARMAAEGCAPAERARLARKVARLRHRHLLGPRAFARLLLRRGGAAGGGEEPLGQGASLCVGFCAEFREEEEEEAAAAAAEDGTKGKSEGEDEREGEAEGDGTAADVPPPAATLPQAAAAPAPAAPAAPKAAAANADAGGGAAPPPVHLVLVSYGRVKGKPAALDHCFNCTRVPNPSVSARKGRTGLDKRLRSEVMAAPAAAAVVRAALAQLAVDLASLRGVACGGANAQQQQSTTDANAAARSAGAPAGVAPADQSLPKQDASHATLRYGFGCAHGKHRSVAIVEHLARVALKEGAAALADSLADSIAGVTATGGGGGLFVRVEHRQLAAAGGGDDI